MKIRTILHEDEIQLTLTTSELVWLQCLLSQIIEYEGFGGYKIEAERLSKYLRLIKPEGNRMKASGEGVGEVQFMNKRD